MALFSEGIIRWDIFAKAEQLRPQLVREMDAFWDSLSLGEQPREFTWIYFETGSCAFLWILKFSDFPRHTHYCRYYYPFHGICGITKEGRRMYAELLKEHYLSLAFSRLPAKWSQQKFKFDEACRRPVIKISRKDKCVTHNYVSFVSLIHLSAF